MPGVADKICGDCLVNPPLFTRTIALFPYEAPIVTLITALKFRGELCCAEALGTELFLKVTETTCKNNELPSALIPVPLHARRLRERGFNQSLEIAKPIARRLSIPIDTKSLLRSKHTIAQTGLSALARKRNVAQAFTATRDFRGRSIALIDDVITTGSTIAACCEALKKGARGGLMFGVWRAGVDARSNNR